MNLLKNPEYKIDWSKVLRTYEESNGIPAIIGIKEDIK